jgi:Tol biopolymer transport system component
MSAWRHQVVTALAVLLLVAGVARTAVAQDYFGQNKVRYQRFDFEVLKTEHFDIYYYPETKPALPDAARMAERWYARLSGVLQHDLTRRQPLILYASHPAFEQTNAIAGDLGEGTGGVTEALKRRIVIPFAGPMAETDHVIGHELVHAFQYDIAGQGRSQTLGITTAARLPMWFMEGMAEYLSLGADDPHTAMWMRDASQSNKLPNYSRLEDPRYFPYRFGQALWAYIAGRFGEDAVARVLKAAGRSGDARQALQSTLGVPADSIVKSWHQSLRDWEGSLARGTEAPSKEAIPLVISKRGGGHMSLAPALSPDGHRLVFFSERSLISIEMYLADASSGKVLRQITRSAVDPEIQNLGFINSAGEWSPDGRRFAFATAGRGRPVLSIMDVASGRIERRLRFPDLGEIFHPTWSPDGRSIAFSALAGGVMDLWVAEVASGAARRLTSDRWADLLPAWSPDGRSIAFVTDRGDTAVGGAYGRYRLALADATTGQVRLLETFAHGKSINPQWAPDGRSLYFVADPDGIPNLYRMEMEDGRIEPLTRLLTGVSGITHLSPAFSVARGSGEIVFSAYEGGSFDLFRLDPTRPAAPRDTQVVAAGATPAVSPEILPPAPRSPVTWADSTRGAIAAVDTMHFTAQRYRPRLSLDYVSQPSLGVAAGSSGVGVGGGAGLYWSDMLGDHELATLLQISNVGGNVLNNTAAAAAYQDLRARWNWGLQASQIPYITQGFDESVGLYNGQPAVRDQELLFWQIERALMANVTYPFNRFSRVEFTGGLRNISFASQVRTRIWNAAGDTMFVDETRANPDGVPTALNLGGGGVAFVYDSGVFGGTSPIIGQRYRFEVNGLAGSIRFHDVLADYRRYVRVARSLVLAGRVLHYGRYGPGSDDPRLSPLYLGDPWLIRGYDYTSFSNQVANGNEVPAIYARLYGSRLAVANLEMRVPLLGALGLFPSPSVPPIETAVFFDAGSAWTRTERAQFLGGVRKTVTSYGVALRANLFGFAVGEADLVHPNDRPGQGWYWELSLQPGF